MQTTRREVLRGFSALAAGALAGGAWRIAAANEPPKTDKSLPTVTLGKTKRVLPRLGLGCFPLGNLENDDDAVAVLHRAMDLGVRYLDTAPSYASGHSERRIGMALEAWLKAHPEFSRSDFYIATKTLHRDGPGAQRELEASLKNLRTSYVDAVQCHEVHDDWESLFAKGAVVEQLEKARADSLVRFVAITGHRNPKYIESAVRRYPPAADGSGFVTALVPVNPVDVQHMSFVRDFLPVAEELGVAVIAMKVFGGGFLLSHKAEDGKDAYTPGELLRYALAQRAVAVAVPGCDKPEQVALDHDAAAGFSQPAQEWLREVESKAPKHLGKSTEWYKDPD